MKTVQMKGRETVEGRVLPGLPRLPLPFDGVADSATQPIAHDTVGQAETASQGLRRICVLEYEAMGNKVPYR